MISVISACIFKKLSKSVNFRVAILILKVEENNIFSILCFISRRVKAQKKKSFAVYGEGAVTDRMCQKWFSKFPARDFLLDDAPQSG